MISYEQSSKIHAAENQQNLTFYKSPKKSKNLYCKTDQKFSVLGDRYKVIQVYTIHKSSQFLSVWSISAHIQYVYWPCFLNTIIFNQINFVANFSSYIMIEGSSQQFLVVSQFSQFFDIMAHVSAERHLSKISFSHFYTPWPPLSF